MRAWRVHELGEPTDVLRLDEVEPPTPGPGEVAIDVAAAALNFPDVLLCRGEYQEKPALPFTPGVEVSGTVAAVGEGVKGLAPGDRVLAAPSFRTGGLTERTIAAAATTYPIPDTMPMPSAAALHITYQTGYLALHRRAAIQPGETLLVHAGAGGVGSAAIQLGLAAGVRVFATAGGPEKTEVCRKLGAELVVDYLAEDFVDAVKEATQGRGADVIYDPVGGDTFDRSRKCIAFEGRILVIGFTSGRIPEAPANHVLIKNYSVVGVHWGLYNRLAPHVPHEIHAELIRLYQEGRIDPLVSQVLPMERAPEALKALGSRGTVGKVVVQISS
ncbi:MAG TPA: NADPH:quinone oxidoreductase family protein [Acidimicrobiales bacterium]|jgi:NADPH2:quinone reductase|nr:NADPH:quinone oxidoreductase family protein [Acidimicrobiales bacterium]